MFEFLQGQSIKHPRAYHWQQLIQKAAELQKLTLDYRSRYTQQCRNYDSDQCHTLARAEALRLNTPNAYEKLAWLERELTTLDLPPTLPKGICHCDFHFFNMFFQEGEFVALLDFDDANYTFLQFDLVGLAAYRGYARFNQSGQRRARVYAASSASPY